MSIAETFFREWGWNQEVFVCSTDAICQHCIYSWDCQAVPEVKMHWSTGRLLCEIRVFIELWQHLAMDQYLYLPFLVGWTSIYQLFWCSPEVQGFDTLPYIWKVRDRIKMPDQSTRMSELDKKWIPWYRISNHWHYILESIGCSSLQVFIFLS